METSHQVTVIVIPPSLSLKDDVQEGSSLTFEDPKTGAKSNARRINYRVGGNAFSTGALPGIVSAKVESPAPEIQLKADVGEFTNNGTEGNILLQASSGGEQVVGSAPVALADKPATSGPQASALNGTVPITWKASAMQDLSKSEYPEILTITLKDA